jgi:hypothetical protein
MIKRLMLLCDRAQRESIAADHLEGMLSEDQVLVEVFADHLVHTAARKRLAKALTGMQERPVVLLRRPERLSPRQLRRLAGWFQSVASRAEVQVVSVSVPRGDRSGTTARKIGALFPADTVVEFDFAPAS